ncbi:sulfite exporter TauE/SafE family protein [Flavicella sp.]|uniref:sulfite exporter TauE/SafE family protein n=1 Tax=Flavicella sp. TaxID=2957742 RepID=UPI00301A49EE
MFFSALLFGLLGSFHCIGMCGPIAMVLPVHAEKPLPRCSKIFLYHLGRIIAYGSIGLIFGLLGKGLFLSGFQQRLSIIIGLFMIVYIIVPSSFFKKIKITSPLYKFIGQIKSGLGKRLKNKSYVSLFIIGFFNGYLPCGMVYMALAGAIAMASPTQGFLYMLIYGLGTIPLMTLIIYFKAILSLKFRNKIQKAIPYFVFIIGFLFILRGLGIGIPYISPSDIQLQIQNEPTVCAPIGLK